MEVKNKQRQVQFLFKTTFWVLCLVFFISGCWGGVPQEKKRQTSDQEEVRKNSSLSGIEQKKKVLREEGQTYLKKFGLMTSDGKTVSLLEAPITAQIVDRVAKCRKPLEKLFPVIKEVVQTIEVEFSSLEGSFSDQKLKSILEARKLGVRRGLAEGSFYSFLTFLWNPLREQSLQENQWSSLTSELKNKDDFYKMLPESFLNSLLNWVFKKAPLQIEDFESAKFHSSDFVKGVSFKEGLENLQGLFMGKGVSPFQKSISLWEAVKLWAEEWAPFCAAESVFDLSYPTPRFVSLASLLLETEGKLQVTQQDSLLGKENVETRLDFFGTQGVAGAKALESSLSKKIESESTFLGQCQIQIEKIQELLSTQ